MSVGVGSVALTLGLAACNGDANGDGHHTRTGQESSAGEGSGERSDEHGGGEGSGEHGIGAEESEGSEGAEVSGAGSEESGVQLALTDTFAQVRAGTRLILVYDSDSNAFVGTVENITTGVLDRVRVEVHLSNGTELGPTTPVDLGPGQTVEIKLPATERPFDGWNPHAEVGGGGAEGSGEHEAGGSAEHGAEGEETEGSEGE